VVVGKTRLPIGSLEVQVREVLIGPDNSIDIFIATLFFSYNA